MELSKTKLENIFLTIPPSTEQYPIVEFLDLETKKIDTLIEKKQQLIELLQEKRTALISHAVTKGLDPDAPMKDSGFEWLGEIPEHWGVIRLKYVAPKSTVKHAKKPENLPYIGLENIESWTGKLSHAIENNDIQGAVGIFENKDILFGKLRPYLAKVVHAKFNGSCTTELLILKPSEIIKDGYLFYILLSEPFINFVNSMTYGAKMPRASWQQIGNMSIVIPDSKEQSLIVEFLGNKTARIDALIDKVQIAIDKLQEYRTALITAAVTGKIDVRNPA